MIRSTIRLRSAFTVRSVAAIYRGFGVAIADTNDIAVDPSGVENPDLNAIPPGESARCQAARDGAALTLTHLATGPLAAVLNWIGSSDLSFTDAQFRFYEAPIR